MLRRREQKNHSAAETKTTRKPGSSRGNSRNERWKPVSANLSLRKLLKVESTMLNAMPSISAAAAKSMSSREDCLIREMRFIENFVGEILAPVHDKEPGHCSLNKGVT